MTRVMMMFAICVLMSTPAMAAEAAEPEKTTVVQQRLAITEQSVEQMADYLATAKGREAIRDVLMSAVDADERAYQTLTRRVLADQGRTSGLIGQWLNTTVSSQDRKAPQAIRAFLETTGQRASWYHFRGTPLLAYVPVVDIEGTTVVAQATP